ncbi:hypothetical protein BA78_2220 [Aspergillus fumigatus]|nr:hypothetical protein BA78_2220 [Aspergillus fumigatus]
MRSFLLAVLGLMATSSLAAPGQAAREGISAFEAIGNLKSGDHVYVHIADDGVARAYDENESVIDYIPLTNGQLKQLLGNLPEPWKKEEDHLHAVFNGVDGRDVMDEKQLLDPPAELRNPMPPLSNRPTGIAEANPALETQLADLWAAHIVRGWMLSFQGERVSAFSGSILSVALAIRHHSKRIWCFLQIIRMCTLDLWGVKGSGHLVVGIRMGFDKDEEASKAIPSLKQSPSLKGLNHLATDGVYRSFSSSGQVVDYKQLSPADITKVLEFHEKYMDSEIFQKTKKKFDGVDGRNVTDLEQLLHPGPESRPVRFRE